MLQSLETNVRDKIANSLAISQYYVLTARRRIEIEELNVNRVSDLKSYIKLVKKWLKGEKRFISDLSRTLKDEFKETSFIAAITDGILTLQKHDTNEP